MADVTRRRSRTADSSSRSDDSRGVSTVVGYVLNLGVATILVTTLLLSAGTLVEDQRENAAKTELRVVGERVAADLAAADRLARASEDGHVTLDVRVPARTVGSAYEIRVNESGSEQVVLVADDPDVRVTVPFESETHVPAATRSSGDFVLVSDGDELEVEDA